jgi:hypothetical protein
MILTSSPGLKGKAESFATAEGIVRYRVFAFLCGIKVVLASSAIYIVITVIFKYLKLHNNYGN